MTVRDVPAGCDGTPRTPAKPDVRRLARLIHRRRRVQIRVIEGLEPCASFPSHHRERLGQAALVSAAAPLFYHTAWLILRPCCRRMPRCPFHPSPATPKPTPTCSRAISIFLWLASARRPAALPHWDASWKDCRPSPAPPS